MDRVLKQLINLGEPICSPVVAENDPMDRVLKQVTEGILTVSESRLQRTTRWIGY